MESQLIKFFKRHQGSGARVKCFMLLMALLTAVVIIFAFIRAVVGKEGWAIAVLVLNIVQIIIFTMDGVLYAFSNPWTLFLVVIADTFALVGNILICK